MRSVFFAISLLLPLLASTAAYANENQPLLLLNEIRYSSTLTTSGQPSEAQMRTVAEAGFERVIFLAFNDHRSAVPNEDRLVRSLGMEYLHIPVAWDAPTVSDFDNFASLMLTSEKTLVHCEVNFRASVFGFLYQVVYRGMPVEVARSLLTSIWVPNETWEAYIVTVLARQEIEYPDF